MIHRFSEDLNFHLYHKCLLLLKLLYMYHFCYSEIWVFRGYATLTSIHTVLVRWMKKCSPGIISALSDYLVNAYLWSVVHDVYQVGWLCMQLDDFVLIGTLRGADRPK